MPGTVVLNAGDKSRLAHGSYVTLRMAEITVPLNLYLELPRLIDEQ